MNLGRRFLILVVLFSIYMGGTALGQGVSDSDFMWIIPETTSVAQDRDTNFRIAILINTKTQAQAFTIPLTFATSADLRIDTTVVYAGSEKGVSMGPAGAASAWTIRSAKPDNTNKTMLIGFLSFGVALPPTNDTLVYVYFDHDADVVADIVDIDSTFISPANHLVLNDPGALEYIPTWTKGAVAIGTTAISGDDVITPATYGLDQNFPNPFNAGTKISFSLAAPGKVELKVYNLLGQSVKTLVDNDLPQGPHNIVWDGTNNNGEVVGSGTYFYRLKVGDVYEEARQMTLLK